MKLYLEQACDASYRTRCQYSCMFFSFQDINIPCIRNSEHLAFVGCYLLPLANIGLPFVYWLCKVSVLVKLIKRFESLQYDQTYKS